MFLSKRSPWILVVAALLFIHGVQALVQGFPPGYSAGLSALARLVVATYLVAIWHFLGANRRIAWRLVLGLQMIVFLILIAIGIEFIVDAPEWWLKSWYATVLSAILGFGWYYGFRPLFRDRARFMAGDTTQ